MKNLLLLFLLLAGAVGLHAQITVTNATFPAAGDSLKFASDLNPESITLTAAGGPFTWDYSDLGADTRQAVFFQPAANGMAFASYPNADLVVIDEVGLESYYEVTATAFNNLGFSGADLFGLPIPADLKFVPPLTERHAPLTFPNLYMSSASLSLAFSTDELPSELLDSLGLPSGLIDSIRVRLTTDRSDFVDAFGTLTIPGGTYEVLREKRTDYTDTRIEVHSFLGWQDITELLGEFGGFGRDTVISYQFISNTEKEPIAVLTMDTTGLVVEEVTFKDNGVASAVDRADRVTVDVLVTPNPVTDVATFRVADLPAGAYTVRLFDGSGQPVQSAHLTGDFTQVSMTDMPTGTYIYQLTDRNGQILATGKLMKTNP